MSSQIASGGKSLLGMWCWVGRGAAGLACGLGLISAAAALGVLAGAGTTCDSLEKGRS